jgi:hypothetical protein
MTNTALTEVSSHQFAQLAQKAGVDLPLEQTAAWDRFDAAVPGRSPWLKLAWRADGEVRALIALAKLKGHGFTYAWAKHGPVWVGGRPSPAEEAEFRRDLRDHVHHSDRVLAFVRLHAYSAAPDLHELLQSITYDQTVVLDLTQSEDDLLAHMKKRGRRDVRKALRDESLVAVDETDSAARVFPELYALLVETGHRDDFSIAPESTYQRMLASLGPDHCRLYTVRRDGRPLCWGIVTLTPTQATYYYAASSAEGRKAGAPDLLVWSMACMLRARGVRSFDMMGIDSPRSPSLAGVRGFKTKFTEEITEVPGAWDMPVRPFFYSLLTRARAYTAQMRRKGQLPKTAKK